MLIDSMADCGVLIEGDLVELDELARDIQLAIEEGEATAGITDSAGITQVVIRRVDVAGEFGAEPY